MNRRQKFSTYSIPVILAGLWVADAVGVSGRAWLALLVAACVIFGVASAIGLGDVVGYVRRRRRQRVEASEDAPSDGRGTPEGGGGAISDGGRMLPPARRSWVASSVFRHRERPTAGWQSGCGF